MCLSKLKFAVPNLHAPSPFKTQALELSSQHGAPPGPPPFWCDAADTTPSDTFPWCWRSAHLLDDPPNLAQNIRYDVSDCIRLYKWWNPFKYNMYPDMDIILLSLCMYLDIHYMYTICCWILCCIILYNIYIYVIHITIAIPWMLWFNAVPHQILGMLALRHLRHPLVLSMGGFLLAGQLPVKP